MEAVWRAQGAPIADDLAPGLPDAQLVALAAENELILPASIRRWWSWHDGTVGGMGSGVAAETGVGPWLLMSSREAFDERAFMLGLNRSPFTADPQDWEAQSAPWWLPLVHFDGAAVFADLRAADEQDAPAHVWSKIPEKFLLAAAFPSWGDLIGRWASALEEGHFRWEPREQAWADWTFAPPEIIELT